jgi:hypothetical protein
VKNQILPIRFPPSSAAWSYTHRCDLPRSFAISLGLSSLEARFFRPASMLASNFMSESIHDMEMSFPCRFTRGVNSHDLIGRWPEGVRVYDRPDLCTTAEQIPVCGNDSLCNFPLDFQHAQRVRYNAFKHIDSLINPINDLAQFDQRSSIGFYQCFLLRRTRPNWNNEHSCFNWHFSPSGKHSRRQ